MWSPAPITIMCDDIEMDFVSGWTSEIRVAYKLCIRLSIFSDVSAITSWGHL